MESVRGRQTHIHTDRETHTDTHRYTVQHAGTCIIGMMTSPSNIASAARSRSIQQHIVTGREGQGRGGGWCRVREKEWREGGAGEERGIGERVRGAAEPRPHRAAATPPRGPCRSAVAGARPWWRPS